MLINSEVAPLGDITIKYFEPGHTFMCADSVYHCAEKAMMKQGLGGHMHKSVLR